MPDHTTRIDIPNSPEFFPAAALVETGVWADLTPPAKALLLVLWDFHRKHPDACHPNRKTLARLSGISPPSVSNALTSLEKIGIVQTIPTPGPRPNTYRLKWTSLRTPKGARPETASPFQRPRADWQLHMASEADGMTVAKYERKGGGLHPMADGCFVRGQVEMAIHDRLVAWGVPHWSEVGYCDLNINLRYPKSGALNQQATVDFVVAPGLLIERLGLAATQGAAKKYRAKAEAKIAAARQAGWTVLVIEPDQRPGDWLLEPIRKAWAKATIEDATRLRRLLKAARKHEAAHGPSRKLDACIKDAKARLTGEKESSRSRGLTTQMDDEYGFPITYRCEPKIVLMEQARPAPEPDDELGGWFDEVPVAHEARRPSSMLGPDDDTLGKLRDLADEVADLEEQMRFLDEADDTYKALQMRMWDLEAERGSLESECYSR
jgi:hypothetical protein